MAKPEYSELQEQEWKIPSSNEYVSDSESPLSLLPLPEVSSPSSSSSSLLLTDTDNAISPKLSYETPQFDKNTQTDQDQFNSVRHHDHIIASNGSIACVRPQSVSILWSNNLKTTIHIKSIKNTTDENSIDDQIVTPEQTLTFEQSPIPEQNPTLEQYKALPTRSNQRKRTRTTTSYDSQTSFYLKSVFFEVYSEQNKLTKKQRAEVQARTGLSSRNITYWFSNHKRRFKDTLKVYKRTLQESQGTIQNYKDFIRWRRSHGLPDQITPEEIA